MYTLGRQVTLWDKTTYGTKHPMGKIQKFPMGQNTLYDKTPYDKTYMGQNTL